MNRHLMFAVMFGLLLAVLWLPDEVGKVALTVCIGSLVVVELWRARSERS